MISINSISMQQNIQTLFKSLSPTMGSNHSDITEQQFNKLWHQTHQFQNVNVWENRINPAQQIEEHIIPDDGSDDDQFLYDLRQNDPHLVSAFALKRGGMECCSSHPSRRIFLEKIPVRLSNVKDIPYPDILHVYDSSVKGYRALRDHSGCFHIDEDMIGINEHGAIKVWLNTAFEHNHPNLQKGEKVQQSVMTNELLDIIESNFDSQTLPPNAPNLSQYLRAGHNDLTLEGVESRLHNYVQAYNSSEMPTLLPCVRALGGIDEVVHWCRNNQAYGYSTNSPRLTESIRLSQLRNSSNVYQNGVYSSIINSQVNQNQVNPQVTSTRVLHIDNEPTFKATTSTLYNPNENRVSANYGSPSQVAVKQQIVRNQVQVVRQSQIVPQQQQTQQVQRPLATSFVRTVNQPIQLQQQSLQFVQQPPVQILQQQPQLSQQVTQTKQVETRPQQIQPQPIQFNPVQQMVAQQSQRQAVIQQQPQVVVHQPSVQQSVQVQRQAPISQPVQQRQQVNNQAQQIQQVTIQQQPKAQQANIQQPKAQQANIQHQKTQAKVQQGHSVQQHEHRGHHTHHGHAHHHHKHAQVVHQHGQQIIQNRQQVQVQQVQVQQVQVQQVQQVQQIPQQPQQINNPQQQQPQSQQNESRLQAQRVINQKIQIKPNQIPSSTLIEQYKQQADKVPQLKNKIQTLDVRQAQSQSSFKDNYLTNQPSSKSSQMMQWQDYTKSNANQQVGQNIQARSIKQSSTYGNGQYAQYNNSEHNNDSLSFGIKNQSGAKLNTITSGDGRTSDDFYKMINEIKANAKISASKATSVGSNGYGSFDHASEDNKYKNYQSAAQNKYGGQTYVGQTYAGKTQSYGNYAAQEHSGVTYGHEEQYSHQKKASVSHYGNGNDNIQPDYHSYYDRFANSAYYNQSNSHKQNAYQQQQQQSPHQELSQVQTPNQYRAHSYEIGEESAFHQYSTLGHGHQLATNYSEGYKLDLDPELLADMARASD